MDEPTYVELSFSYDEYSDNGDLNFEHFGYFGIDQAILELLQASYSNIDWSKGCCIRPLENDGFHLRDSETERIIIH